MHNASDYREKTRCLIAWLSRPAGGATDIHEAMHRGKGLVRMDGYWATADLGRAHSRDGLADRLAKLPAVLVPVQNGKSPTLVVNEERLGIFRGVDNLARYAAGDRLP